MVRRLDKVIRVKTQKCQMQFVNVRIKMEGELTENHVGNN